jgi:hypothetical protein
MSVSAMTSAALARRPDFEPHGVPRGLTGIAEAAVAAPRVLAMPQPPAQPGTVLAMPAPLQPRTSAGPAPPTQPGERRLPAPPAQPGAVPPGTASTRPDATLAANAGASVTTALQVISSYIPTEIVTVYVAVLAALREPSTDKVSPLPAEIFWGFLIATPIVVWLVFAAKVRSADVKRPLPLAPGAWPVWEMFAATVAFISWAVALTPPPFKEVSPSTGGLLVLGTSTVLGLIAPVFQRHLDA